MKKLMTDRINWSLTRIVLKMRILVKVTNNSTGLMQHLKFDCSTGTHTP